MLFRSPPPGGGKGSYDERTGLKESVVNAIIFNETEKNEWIEAGYGSDCAAGQAAISMMCAFKTLLLEDDDTNLKKENYPGSFGSKIDIKETIKYMQFIKWERNHL